MFKFLNFPVKEASSTFSEAEKKARVSFKSVAWGIPARAAQIETVEHTIGEKSQVHDSTKGIKIVYGFSKGLFSNFCRKSATLTVKLYQTYTANPVAVCWAAHPHRHIVRKLCQNATSLSNNSIIVQVEEQTEPELIGTRLHTVVYQSSSTHPKFKAVIQSIMTSNANAGTLEKSIQELFSPQYGLTINDTDEEGQTLLHAAW